MRSLDRQRTFFLRLTIGLGLLALAACGGQDEPPESKPESKPEPGSAQEAGTDSVASGTLVPRLDSLFDQAQKVYRQGDYDAAYARLSDLHRRAAEENDRSVEARALTWMAYAQWWLGDHEGAKKAAGDALDFKLAQGIRDQLFRSYNQLGLFAWREYRYTEATAWYERSVEAAEQDGDEFGAATARGNLALVQTELGRFQEAQAGFQAMRETMVRLDSTFHVANSLNNLGMLEIRVGHAQAAIPLVRQALALYEQLGAPYYIQNALGQLGTAYTALGDPARAFAALDSALALAEAHGLRQDQAINLELMAEIYRRSGDVRRALRLYDSAKAINAELGLDLQTGIDLRGEADIHVQLGDLARAQALAEEALKIHRRAGAALEELFDLLMLAEVFDLLEQPERAQAHLQEADRLAETLSAGSARVQVALSRARIADRRGRSSEVLDAIRGILPDLARSGYAEESSARLLESRALERQGAIEEAVVAGRRALETVERVRGNFGSGVLRSTFLASEGEIYAHLVSLLLRLGEVGAAFEVADGARGRALLERLAAQPSGVGGRVNGSSLSEGEALLRKIDGLTQNIQALEQMLPSERSEDHSTELVRLYEALEEARREYEGLLIQKAEARAAAASFAAGGRTGLEVLRRSLGRGQLLLEFFVSPEGNLVIFAVARDGVQVLDGPISRENLVSRVRLVRELISQPGEAQNRTRRLLTRLHEVLVQPAIRAGVLAEAQELIIVPHGVLNYLPFAALRDGITDRYLVEDFTVRILPSAAALEALGERPPKEVGVMASVFAPFPDRLPGTRQEALTVSAGRRRTARHVGSRATERGLRRAMATSRVVHVATHGVMNVRNPMFSRLELARNGADDPGNDGRLEVHELLDLSIQASLVFLSGCETGVGGAHSTAFDLGADYATLAQAFLYAGASNVIATLWPVEDDGAAELARQFYEALEDSSPATALAQAQRAMLSHERYDAPYHWAPYQVAGNDDAPWSPHRATASSVQ